MTTFLVYIFIILEILSLIKKKVNYRTASAGPSEGIPEGLVIVGYDGSPEDLSVGQDVDMKDRDTDNPDPVWD